MKRSLVSLLAALIVIPALADFPDRPITFVVPYAAGGPADLIGRAVAQEMSALAGQPIIVENRAGAGGNIAGDFVARAHKDGYTLLFGSSPVLVMNPSLYKNLKFNPLTDFQPIADFGSLPNAVLVNQSSGIKDVQELIAKGKAEPISYASAGAGGTTHLSGVLFGQKTGAQVLHVPYKGSGPALQALLGNQVMATFTDIFTAKPFVESGQLRMLALTSDKRSPLFPAVPTLGDAGVKGVDVHVFFALLAPAGVPQQVTDKLSSLAQTALKKPALRQQLESRGLAIPADNTPQRLSEKMRRETQDWAEVVRASGAALD